MAQQSEMTQVLQAIERVNGRVAVKNFQHFKRITDCPLSIRQIEIGVRAGRNRGLLKLRKTPNGVTRVRRTSKSL